MEPNNFRFSVCYKWPVRFYFPHFQDDMHVRVYNYNTLERVHQFDAHSDYLRAIAVHPTQPYILTSSGNMQFTGFVT